MNSKQDSMDDGGIDQSSGNDSVTEATKPEIRPLRVWPAILFVFLIWGLRIGSRLADEPSFGVLMAGFMGPCLVSLLILLWWIFFSRALIKEKLIGALGLIIIIVLTTALSHKTVFGFGTMIYAVPWGMTAFAVVITCARRRYPARTALALLAALIGFGYWDLVRTDEIHGDFKAVQNWRWEPTAEERFLETLATRAPTPDVESREPLASPEWPGFRGADRRGEQSEVVLVEDWQTHPPREIWRVRVGPGWSSFSVAGNRLFTQEQRGDDEVVVCYSARDGSELWTHQDVSRFWETIGGAGPRATPTIAGDGLYTLGANGLLNRLDPLTGRLVWQCDLRKDAGRNPPEWGFASSPLVTHGLVIVHAGGTDDKGVLAYDETTGELRWSAPAGGHSYSSPQLSMVDGKECVLMLTNKGIRFVEPETGDVIGNHVWEFKQYRVVQPLVVAGSSVLLGTPMGMGTQRVDARWDGEQFVTETGWISKRMKPYFNDFVSHDGFLYGFDNNVFACVDIRDGEKKWKQGRFGHGQVLLLPSGGQLLVISEQGELVLLRASPDSFSELGRHKVLSGRTWNHPVVVGNRLYVRNGVEAACFELAINETP
ncbi:MAG: PQQ-like beta-propeller repeat protein [Planctomycetes bacterium]|nr:PQQ-like beta-propeller repeat protein [Planctomycetota bacterium]